MRTVGHRIFGPLPRLRFFCNLAGARGAKRVTVKTDTAANGGIVISDSMLVQANGSSLQEIQLADFSLLPPVGDETFIFQTLRLYSNLEIFGGSISNGQNILFGNYSFGRQNPNAITQYIEVTNARGEISVFSSRPSTYISPKNIYIAEINPVVLFPESGVYRVKIYALEDVSGNRSETISWTIQVARNQTGAYSLSDQGHYFASMCFAGAVRAACDVPIAARFGVGVANGSAGMVPRLVLMSERPRISLDMRPIIGDYFNNWGVDFTRTSSDPLEGYIQNPATGKNMGYFRIYGTDAFIPKPN